MEEINQRALEEVAELSGVVEYEGGAICKGRRGFFLGMMGRHERGIRRPGNTSVRDLTCDKRFIGVVLRSTGVGKVKAGVLALGRTRGGWVSSDPRRFLPGIFPLIFRSSFHFFLFQYFFLLLTFPSSSYFSFLSFSFYHSAAISLRFLCSTLNTMIQNKTKPIKMLDFNPGFTRPQRQIK